MAAQASTPAESSPATEAAGVRVDYSIAGIIGSQLSVPVTVMQEILGEFMQTKKMSRTQMKALTDSMESIHVASKQAQQLARLSEGRLRQSHERLSLDAIVNEALDGSADLLRKRGVELHRSIKPVEVIVDPGLLSSLADAAVEWASAMGQRLQVSLHIKNWPEYGVLMFKFSNVISDSAASVKFANGEDRLGWHLLNLLAQAMGVGVERVEAPDGGMLVIEFPRTVKQLEGMTAVEVDAGGDSQLHSESRPLAGHRVLLVTTDGNLAADIKAICRNMGLMVDTVPSTGQAVRYVELDPPHMIIIDEALRDDRFKELREDLLRSEPNFPFVEIAMGFNKFELASWTGDSMSRVSRDTMPAQLPSILVMELARTI